jgi:hypothetical protein
MQNITYPHLIQQEGMWRIIPLETWRTDSTTIPIKYQKLSELDAKIFNFIRNEYHIFRKDMTGCFSTPKSGFGIRSPYANIPDQTVPYVRALLCQWMNFSYHNWIAHPSHIYLGRMCATLSCRNPTHHTFGRRKGKAATYFDLQDTPDSPPPDRETEDWIDYTTAVEFEIREALEAEADPESLFKEFMSRAQTSWGKDRPLPPYALITHQSVEHFIRDTIETIKRPPTLISKSNKAQIAESVAAMERIKRSLKGSDK